MKGMILAAGLGTRLKPLTNTKPKALIEVGGHTMLELAVNYLVKYGIHNIIINVHHHADQIEEYVKSQKYFGIDICFSDERAQLLNTGGAIVHASHFLDTSAPFVLMAVDVLTDLHLGNMMDCHLKTNALVTLAVKQRQTSRSLLFNDDMKLIGWKNNQNGEIRGCNPNDHYFHLGFSGIHILSPLIFQLIAEKGAFSIIELYLRLMQTKNIKGFRHDEGSWLEFGRLDRLAEIAGSEDFKRLIAFEDI